MNMFAVYFDFTGAGRCPEPIAGPFESQEEAEEYMKENEYEDSDEYFVDRYIEED
jgi:hypothetical protein